MKSGDRNTILPNFVVIGAPKSGTTSLFYYLRQHPDIFLPVKKELHYYSYSEIESHAEGPGDHFTIDSLCATRDDYLKNYRSVKKEIAIGEISPSYLYYAEGVAAKIKKELSPSVKIIMILRNPIDKAYSQYMHLVRDQRETLPFYDALLVESEREDNNWGDIWLYANSSLYAKKVKHYLSIFDKKNVKILFFDEFIENPNVVLKSIFQFLGVDSKIKCNTQTIYNRTGNSKSKLISNFFNGPNLLKSILKMVIPERVRIPIRLFLLNLNTGKKRDMDSTAKEYLSNFFYSDIRELENFLNIKTGWISK